MGAPEAKMPRWLEQGLRPTKPAAPPAPAVRQLPRELAGAKPRYGFGRRQFRLSFESDIDRALYVIAQPKRSRRDGDYLGWLRRVSGRTEAELRKAGRGLRDQIKTRARAADPEIKTLVIPEGGPSQTPKARPSR